MGTGETFLEFPRGVELLLPAAETFASNNEKSILDFGKDRGNCFGVNRF